MAVQGQPQMCWLCCLYTEVSLGYQTEWSRDTHRGEELENSMPGKAADTRGVYHKETQRQRPKATRGGGRGVQGHCSQAWGPSGMGRCSEIDGDDSSVTLS